jgi:hypothetical protein
MFIEVGDQASSGSRSDTGEGRAELGLSGIAESDVGKGENALLLLLFTMVEVLVSFVSSSFRLWLLLSSQEADLFLTGIVYLGY